jgi:hypothetical protein
MSVEDLLARISSRELSEWMAFDRIHTSEDWHRHAQLCHVLVQLLGDSKVRRKIKLEDFLPRGRAKPNVDRQALQARLDRMRADRDKKGHS